MLLFLVVIILGAISVIIWAVFALLASSGDKKIKKDAPVNEDFNGTDADIDDGGVLDVIISDIFSNADSIISIDSNCD